MARAADQAYEHIHARISDGQLEPGEHLREEELAEAIGVSRTPIREALRQLASEGVVEFIPNRGAQVANYSNRDLAEIFDLRAVLEGFAARLAARNATADHLASMQAIAQQMEAVATGDSDDRLDRLSVLNRAFHDIIVDAAGNRRLGQLIAGLVQVPLVNRTFRRYSDDELRRSLGHHRELIDALRAGDANWAGTVMRSHVYAARSVLDADLVAESADHL